VPKIARLQYEIYVPCMAFFNIRKSLARNHPLASPLLSAERRDAGAVWTSRLRSGNFVWRHVLHMCPSTSCRLAFAQVVAAESGWSKCNFASLWVCLARTDSQLLGRLLRFGHRTSGASGTRHEIENRRGYPNTATGAAVARPRIFIAR
jgi:hypothetical protein